VTGNNVDEALTWILNNGERLSEEDEAMEAGGAVEIDGDEDESMDEDEEDETEIGEAVEGSSADKPKDGSSAESKVAQRQEEDTPGWTGTVIPLRFISGRANVNPRKMEVSGLPTGGFSSVGTKGILLTSGKWYYEAILETAGCLQIGWADGSFAGHCHADRGDGCGDGPSSWAFDGWRRYRWHATATEWGCRWKEGDVIGCFVDMDERVVSFTLNGQAESVGMGVAFSGEGFRPCSGVYACVSFNRREKLRLILGGPSSEPFKYQPPAGYRGVGEAVLEAAKEMDVLLEKEKVLDTSFHSDDTDKNKRFLCDFSDGEHGHELTAWAHRYYGSDASVHLGSGRPKQGVQKSSSGLSSIDAKPSASVNRLVEKAWLSGKEESEQSEAVLLYEDILERMKVGYEEVQRNVIFELFNECLAMGMLLSRKLILHVLVTKGLDFDPGCFVESDSDRLRSVRKFWKVVEVCSSLRNAGWVGEAGTMALAAEALGLGISGNDQMQSRSGDRPGVTLASDLDEGLMLPTGGFTQVLGSVLRVHCTTDAADTNSLESASAEASMGSEGGGGLLSFLQDGLQSAARRSEEFRRILLASVRRSVRLLSAVEYNADDFDSVEHEVVSLFFGPLFSLVEEACLTFLPLSS
jgi:hypothetical protein